MLLDEDNLPHTIKNCPACGHELKFLSQKTSVGYSTFTGFCAANAPKRESSQANADVWIHKTHFWLSFTSYVSLYPGACETIWTLKHENVPHRELIRVSFNYREKTSQYQWWEEKGRKKKLKSFQIKGWHLPPVFKTESYEDIRKWILRRVLLK